MRYEAWGMEYMDLPFRIRVCRTRADAEDAIGECKSQMTAMINPIWFWIEEKDTCTT